SQENGKGQVAGVPDSSAHEVPHPWSRRSKLRIPRKWRAVRRGCSYARMRSHATSLRTPSARPVFPSPSCCSATRSISVAATPPPFSNLPNDEQKASDLRSGVLTDSHRNALQALLTLGPAAAPIPTATPAV